MKLGVQTIEAADWGLYCATQAHRCVFDEKLPPGYDRIDFALLVVDEEAEHIVGYVTCREFSAEDVYLKHGGAFPHAKGTVWSLRAYVACLAELKERGFKRATTLVENTNAVYLKMALSAGFRPIGIRNFKGDILVELLLNWE